MDFCILFLSLSLRFLLQRLVITFLLKTKLLTSNLSIHKMKNLLKIMYLIINETFS